MKFRRGSGIIAVLVATTALAIILASVLDFARTEKTVNNRAFLHMQARNAAEAVLEYGFSELEHRFETRTQFRLDELQPGNNPIILPGEFFDLYDGTTRDDSQTEVSIILPGEPYDGTVAAGNQPTEIAGGVIPPGQWMFIDPDLNADDIMKGKRVLVRGVQLIGRATGLDKNGDELIVHATQTLQVRDAPLFSHAVYYNMDMEIAPGPAMEIHGPVHVNGDMYVQAGNAIDFYDSVTASGDIFHGPKGGFGKSTSNGNVRFRDNEGNLVDMNDEGCWLDSHAYDWKTASAQRWHYNVQSSDHGVPAHNPVAIDDYVADDLTTADDETRNYGYQMIQNTLSSDDSSYDPAVEEQKFAYKAGLTIEVDPATSTYEVYTYNRDHDGNVVYDGNGDPEKISLTAAEDFVEVDAWNHSTFTADPDPNMMVDKRRNENLGLATIDVGVLKELIDSNDSDNWDGTPPADFWNGVVYVKMPQGSTPGTDGVYSGTNGWGVMLKNGSEIPNGEEFGSDRGMTVATNNALYVQGNYNADGDPGTGSALDPEDGEPPAALAADSITILSENWENARSDSANKNDRPASFTEVAAALLTGIVPSDRNDNDTYSGGVENFPRFLENWSGETLVYRGSLVALFESEIAQQGWTGSVYSPPNRDWGFNQLFAMGDYPPGSPNVRTYRRVDFRTMTADEYAAAAANIANEFAENNEELDD